jgi:glycosyltransferase involved in cell wall biosynthesis
MRILHVFRSPVGGLFRHVRDLARGQQALGHEVGLLCDNTTGGATADKLLEDAAQFCSLGIARKSISRLPGFGDVAGVRAAMHVAREKNIDIIHGHGAKGGLYARLAGRLLGIPSTYTPHGGSLHYQWASAAGLAFLTSEMILARLGSGFCFVCDFERKAFAEKIGLAGKPYAMVHNGLWPEEFISRPFQADASDFLFVGEIRHLKGIDLLLNALARLPGTTLTVVGDGAEQPQYEELSRSLGLGNRVRFAGRKQIAEAVQLGRVMVLPSRHETFPYVVLETAAAGLPLIAADVGGIAEVVPKYMLFAAEDVDQLSRMMAQAMAKSNDQDIDSKNFSTLIRERCSASQMAAQLCAFYEKLRLGTGR